MATYDDLVRNVQSAGQEIFWQGAVAPSEIEKLEALLQCKLPLSFRKFLAEYGGGGPVGAEVSGIEAGDAGISTGGTVYGDTLECTTRYALPAGMPVIYFHDDEVCWCLDASAMANDECPVVAYDLFRRKRDREIAKNFGEFFRQHLELYGSPQ